MGWLCTPGAIRRSRAPTCFFDCDDDGVARVGRAGFAQQLAGGREPATLAAQTTRRGSARRSSLSRRRRGAVPGRGAHRDSSTRPRSDAISASSRSDASTAHWSATRLARRTLPPAHAARRRHRHRRPARSLLRAAGPVQAMPACHDRYPYASGLVPRAGRGCRRRTPGRTSHRRAITRRRTETVASAGRPARPRRDRHMRARRWSPSAMAFAVARTARSGTLDAGVARPRRSGSPSPCRVELTALSSGGRRVHRPTPNRWRPTRASPRRAACRARRTSVRCAAEAPRARRGFSCFRRALSSAPKSEWNS